MRFEIIKDQARAKQLIEKHQKDWKKFHDVQGNLVSWSMPALPEPLPKLKEIIYDSEHREKYYHIYYFIETKGKFISHIIPAAEYYKFVFKTLAEKRYSLRISIEKIQGIIDSILGMHQKTRTKRPVTGQPSFRLIGEVYALKSELAAFLFIGRSIMDTLSTLMHFLYGPKSKQFSSFSDFAKYISRRGSEKGELYDPKFCSYCESNLEWYWRLRDIRDYVAHTSSVEISFYEDVEGKIKIYMENKFEITDFINNTIKGLNEFIQFCDVHFSSYLSKDII